MGVWEGKPLKRMEVERGVWIFGGDSENDGGLRKKPLTARAANKSARNAKKGRRNLKT